MISGVSNSPTRYRPQATAQTAAAAPSAPASDSSAIASRPQTKPVVQAGGGFDAAGLLDGIMNMLKSVGSFIVGLFNKIFKKGGGDTPAPVDDNTLKLAQQYGLLPTKENVDAFVTEVQGYAAPGPGGFQTLGPGSPNTEAIAQIQTALKAWGYPAEVTGQYDAPTQAAVKAFKQANGLHQTYKSADGNFAVNEYFDYQTYQKMQEKMSGGTTTPPTNPTPTSGNGTLNWQAIANQYKLYPTEDNVQAFLAEVKGYQTPDAQGFKAIGPGYPNQAEIQEVQGALAKVGFQVTPNGQWDAATVKAVMDFKAKYGLHQNYRSADGNWAINEYADKAMLQKLSSLLG